MNSTKKKALVTGACGFIGSHLVDQLLEEGWEVRATDLPKASRRWIPSGVPFVPSDLTSPETLGLPLRDMDVVFHLAALSDSSVPWERLYRVNVLGTENLLLAARKAGVERIVSWSSYGVYGKFDRRRLPVDETHPVRPRDPVSRSKAMKDAVVWRYHDEGPRATILRPSAPYGPRARRGMADLLHRLDRLPVVPVFRNLANRIPSVHVQDVVRAASFAAQEEACRGQEYNLTDDGGYGMSEFLSLAASALGKSTVSLWFPGPFVQAAAAGSLAVSRLLNVRPLVGEDTVRSFSCDFFASNQKIKSLGFSFLHPHPGKAIPQVIEELRREGLL